MHVKSLAFCVWEWRRYTIQYNDTQGGFCSCRGITDQIFILQQYFVKSWKYGKDVYTRFVDLEKAYDQVPRE